MTNIVISAIRSGIRYESLIPRFGICIDLGYLVFDCLGELPIFSVGVLMHVYCYTDTKSSDLCRYYKAFMHGTHINQTIQKNICVLWIFDF